MADSECHSDGPNISLAKLQEMKTWLTVIWGQLRIEKSLLTVIPECKTLKKISFMLPTSKMEFDHVIDTRKH